MNERKMTVIVSTPYGIHGNRLAQELQSCIGDYKGSVFIEKDGRRVSVNSLIGILSLGITDGDALDFIVSEDDDNAGLVLEKLRNVICR